MAWVGTWRGFSGAHGAAARKLEDVADDLGDRGVVFDADRAVHLDRGVERARERRALDDRDPCFLRDLADLERDRIDAQRGLEHPYCAQFRDPETETLASVRVSIPISDNIKMTTSQYREACYSPELLEQGVKSLRSAAK